MSEVNTMSKVISLKLRDDIYEEAEVITHQIHAARNDYINAAIEFYNKVKKRALL